MLLPLRLLRLLISNAKVEGLRGVWRSPIAISDQATSQNPSALSVKASESVKKRGVYIEEWISSRPKGG